MSVFRFVKGLGYEYERLSLWRTHSISIVKSINTFYLKLSSTQINCILRTLQVLRKHCMLIPQDWMQDISRMTASHNGKKNKTKIYESFVYSWESLLNVICKFWDVTYSGCSSFLFLLYKSSQIAHIAKNTVKKYVYIPNVSSLSKFISARDTKLSFEHLFSLKS